MKETAEKLGFSTTILSSSVYEDADETINNFKKITGNKKL